MLPPQPKPVGGTMTQFVEGWKLITNDPDVLSLVAKGYSLRFTSQPLLLESLWEIRSPQGQDEIQGMRDQIYLMLQKNAITEVPPDSPGFYSNIFLVRKASGGWRPVIELNAHIQAPHFRMFTISLVLSTVKKATMPSKSICRMRTFMYCYIPAAGSTSGLPSRARSISFGYFPSV